MLSDPLHWTEWFNGCVSSMCLVKTWPWSRLMFVSLFLFFTALTTLMIITTTHQCWKLQMWQAHCLQIILNRIHHPSQHLAESIDCGKCYPVFSSGFELASALPLCPLLHWRKLFIIVDYITYHQAAAVKCIFDLLFYILPESFKHTAFFLGASCDTLLKHFMMLKSEN